MLTAVTLAIGVATWAFSPIKFQADMGILLAFMFLWNMLGALVMLPALARFLLPPKHPGIAFNQISTSSSAEQTQFGSDKGYKASLLSTLKRIREFLADGKL